MPEKSTNMNMLGSTARWIAAARALESGRKDRLFDDPWATMLAGEEGAAWAANRSPESLVPIVLRIHYFDDFLHWQHKVTAYFVHFFFAQPGICREWTH